MQFKNNFVTLSQVVDYSFTLCHTLLLCLRCSKYVANRKAAVCPGVDKLWNINTRIIVSPISSLLAIKIKINLTAFLNADKISWHIADILGFISNSLDLWPKLYYVLILDLDLMYIKANSTHLYIILF